MNKDEKGRRFYRREDIWRETGLSRATVDRLLAAGTLKKVKVGSNTLIPAESYEQWIASLNQNAS
ncbi:helix-turn-helix transcriptional regulator [Acetobacter sicerae]|uniref:helix-turn-helix transcriptional regulator n=1 Tax=Acetobacter sicerae TaxID=85325 RepID=UPI00156B42C0|nr:hypothetical protein [Acetobacter sicerae]NHN92321.1 hypothetical protein [Acetobacter sicerae]